MPALPTIDLLDYNLRGCAVLRVEGILNATTNYLLDAMTERGIGFAAALREAQEQGFAEREPSFDTEGCDTACKLLILANFGLGADLSIDGIQCITERQIDAWRKEGLTPKLVGRLHRECEGLRASVGVRTYPLTDPFAHVRGKNKAIRITTDVMGETVAMGCGPEPMATAAAALKDLEHILRSRSARQMTS